MKRTATLLTLSISTFFLAIAPAAFASSQTNVEVSNNGEGASTSVNVESNTGGNTICQNGKCTTTSGGTGTSKVCINGDCHTNEDGNVNYQSDDGKTKVNIKTNNDTPTEVQQNTTDPTDTPEVKPTTTPKVLGMKDEVEQKKKALETKKFDLMKFFDSEMASIKKLFSLDFLFGKKE